MRPLTGRALTSAQLKCQHAGVFFLAQCGRRPALTAHSWPSDTCCCQGNGSAFPPFFSIFSVFFQIGLIGVIWGCLTLPAMLFISALFSSAALFLSTCRQYLCLVSFLSFSSTPSDSLSHKWPPISLTSLSSICFFFWFNSVWPLFALDWLLIRWGKLCFSYWYLKAALIWLLALCSPTALPAPCRVSF